MKKRLFNLFYLTGIFFFLFWFYTSFKTYLNFRSFGSPVKYISNIIILLPDTFLLIIRNATSAAILFILYVISYRIGGILFKIFDVEDELTCIEKNIFRIISGFGIIAYFILISGFAGLLYKIPMTIFFLIVFILCLWKFPIQNFKPVIRFKFDLLSISAVIVFFLFFLLNLIMSYSPEIFYDALVYHLAVPKLYLMHHKIFEIPYIAHSNFPSTQQMLYLVTLIQGDETAAKLLHFSMGILTVILLYSVVSKNIRIKHSGLISVLLYYSLPIVSYNSWHSGNDVASALFFAAAVASALNLFYGKNIKFIYVSSVFLGLTLSIKYTTVFSVAGLFAAIVIYISRKYQLKTCFSFILKSSAVIFLIISIWLIKNFIFTGNPVYPFLCKYFGGDNLIQLGGGNFFNMALNVYNFDMKKLLLSLWDLTMTGDEIGIHFLVFFPFLIIPFFTREKKIILLTAGFIISYILWYMGTPQYRFLIPAFIIFSIILSYCICYAALYNRIISWSLVFIIFLSFFINNIQMYDSLDLTGYFQRKISKEDYLSTPKILYPRYSYKTILWANANLDKNSKIMIAGESRAYYLNIDFISYSLELNKQPLMEFIKNSSDEKELLNEFKNNRITHLLINYWEAMRINPSYRTFYWNNKDRDIFDKFWKKYVSLEYFKYGSFLYKINTIEQKIKIPPLNLLEQLEKNSWDQSKILQIYYDNKEYGYMIDEFEFLQTQGYDMTKEIARIKLK
ncbi:glycosyltransferase family 39 protein [Candidatus Dependentiae bacterium]|nr:glycosyltransferase family 39 protein [Candidatus Dependentiae bacterium]